MCCPGRNPLTLFNHQLVNKHVCINGSVALRPFDNHRLWTDLLLSAAPVESHVGSIVVSISFVRQEEWFMLILVRTLPTPAWHWVFLLGFLNMCVWLIYKIELITQFPSIRTSCLSLKGLWRETLVNVLLGVMECSSDFLIERPSQLIMKIWLIDWFYKGIHVSSSGWRRNPFLL